MQQLFTIINLLIQINEVQTVSASVLGMRAEGETGSNTED